jgi:PTS system nitrogen regulatory IIA component
MMISHILSEEDISLDLVTKGKHSALSRIAVKIARRSGLDEQMVFRGLLDREFHGSTGIGRGVAIPHALLDMISAPVASLTRLAQPIDFHGPDDDPVDLLYTLLWPRSSVPTFLPALSQMCRLLRTPQVREGLRQARSADEVMAILDTDPRPAISTNSHTCQAGLGIVMPRQLSNAETPLAADKFTLASCGK